MQVSPQITFRNMTASPSLEAQVARRIEELEQFFDRITGCQVVIEEGHRHHHQGKLFHVRIELIVPGTTIVVSRDPGQDHVHEDAHVAVRDAFDTARRQLEDHVRRGDGRVKSHAPRSGD
ncbi:MAG TPA: HPF/RaiA family ribosome-associated protein [Stellaceae bacterium]|nr:HPF/RaiA family ribosome-associated protein [Stellaceae bacterium]